MAPMATQDDYVKTALRLPRDLHLKLQGSADATSKSMNAEIVSRLEESFIGGQGNLTTAIARLTLELAMVDTAKVTAQMRTTLLAVKIRLLGETLLDRLGAEDEDIKDQARAAINIANEFYHSPESLSAQAELKATALHESLQQINQLTGKVMDPDLSAAIRDVAKFRENHAKGKTRLR